METPQAIGSAALIWAVAGRAGVWKSYGKRMASIHTRVCPRVVNYPGRIGGNWGWLSESGGLAPTLRARWERSGNPAASRRVEGFPSVFKASSFRLHARKTKRALTICGESGEWEVVGSGGLAPTLPTCLIRKRQTKLINQNGIDINADNFDIRLIHYIFGRFVVFYHKQDIVQHNVVRGISSPSTFELYRR